VVAKLVINGRQVEVHLARELGFEVLDLQLDDDKAAQTQVVKEKVEVIVLARDLEVVLAAELLPTPSLAGVFSVKSEGYANTEPLLRWK
jgi:hypothetical protein